MSDFDPLIAFVHIPKTAGSTINEYLREAAPGQDHIESWLGAPDQVSAKLAKLKWVSGHVEFSAMQTLLSVEPGRRIEFFTALRDPAKQISSHYNWLIEIFHRSQQFYNAHPERIKEISHRIRHADNSNPKAIIEQLELAPGLFLNQQSRVLLGNAINDASMDDIDAVLKKFRFVATERTLPNLVRLMVGAEYTDKRRSNTSTYHFDPEVFQTPELIRFLKERNAQDFRVYERISEIYQNDPI